MRKRFLPILGRSVRADLIGRQFWPNPVDFGKNRRFPGFGLVDGRDIAHAARGFLPIIGRRAGKDGTEIARHLDFVKIAMISRFRFDPVHLGAPMGPALTDQRWHRKIGKNLHFSDALWRKVRAASVRHFYFAIFVL